MSAAQQPTGLDDPGYQRALYNAAMLYTSRGWSVIPLAPIRYRPDGKKRIQPLIKWVTEPGQLITRTDQVEQWFGPLGPARGIAVATGPSGLFMLDSDAYKDGAEEREPPAGAWVERHAGRGGWHAYLSNPTGARNTAGRIGMGVDSRGDGGLSVCAPTRSLHPDGSTTQWQTLRPLIELQQLPPAPAELLAAAPIKIRHLGAVGEATEVSPAAAAESVRRWRDDYLATAHGGRHTALIQYLAVLTRHRLAEGIAVQDVVGELEAAALAHPDAVAGEEFESVPDAIEWAIDKARSGPWIIVEETGLFAASPPLPETPAAVVDESLFAFGDDEFYDNPAPPAEAEWGAFGGDVPLFYATGVHWLQGASESGKTWVAAAVVAERLAAGDAVMVVDYEDTRANFVGRLAALSMTREQHRRLVYIDPSAVSLAQLTAHLDTTERDYALMVVDGVTSSLNAMGKSGRDEQEVTQWTDRLPRKARASICIDHVVKSLDDRQGMAIGSQAKKSVVTGTAWEVTALSHFGRGRSGVIRLSIQKDKPGGVRGRLTSKTVDLDLESTDGGASVALSVRAGSEGGLFGETDPNSALFSALYADGVSAGVSGNELLKLAKDRGAGFKTTRKVEMQAAYQRYVGERFAQDEAGSLGPLENTTAQAQPGSHQGTTLINNEGTT